MNVDDCEECRTYVRLMTTKYLDMHHAPYKHPKGYNILEQIQTADKLADKFKLHLGEKHYETSAIPVIATQAKHR